MAMEKMTIFLPSGSWPMRALKGSSVMSCLWVEPELMCPMTWLSFVRTRKPWGNWFMRVLMEDRGAASSGGKQAASSLKHVGRSFGCTWRISRDIVRFFFGEACG